MFLIYVPFTALIYVQTLHRHEINNTNAGNMKTCGSTKVWVLNPNLTSKISYETIFDNFQNEAVNRSGVLAMTKAKH